MFHKYLRMTATLDLIYRHAYKEPIIGIYILHEYRPIEMHMYVCVQAYASEYLRVSLWICTIAMCVCACTCASASTWLYIYGSICICERVRNTSVTVYSSVHWRRQHAAMSVPFLTCKGILGEINPQCKCRPDGYNLERRKEGKNGKREGNMEWINS